jgi:tetratricopeptide (TPR) repeat protein
MWKFHLFIILGLVLAPETVRAQNVDPNTAERTARVMQLVDAENLAAAKAIYQQEFASIADPKTRDDVVRAGLQFVVAAMTEKMDGQGLSLVSSGRLAEAKDIFAKTLRLRENAFGPEYTGVAISLNNIALVLINEGGYKEAEPLLRRAISLREKLQGKDSSDLVAPLTTLGGVVASQQRFAEGETLFRRALAINERNGANIRERIVLLRNLANVYGDEGKIEQAQSTNLEAGELERRK